MTRQWSIGIATEQHNVPLYGFPALFGMIAALRFAGVSQSILSCLGMTTGVGTVARNGILALDYFGQSRARGVGLAEGLLQTRQRRHRLPVQVGASVAHRHAVDLLCVDPDESVVFVKPSRKGGQPA